MSERGQSGVPQALDPPDSPTAVPARLPMILQSLRDGIVVQDADGAIVESNEAAHRILGLTADQMSGRTSMDPRWQAIHEDGSPFPVQTHPAMILATIEAVHDALIGVHKPDGSLTWILVKTAALPTGGEGSQTVTSLTDVTRVREVEQRSRPVTEIASHVVGDGGRARDVDEVVRVEGAPADTSAQLETVMAVSAIGMFIVAPDGAFERVNQALCDFLGRSREELLVSRWQELTHPSDLDADSDLLAQMLGGERETYRLTKRYLRPNGTVVWGDLSVSCLRDEFGQVRHLVCQVVDITEAERDRRALQETQRNFRLLAEQASDLVFRADTDLRLTWVSPSVTGVLGWAVEDLLGTRLTDLVRPGQEGTIAADYLRAHSSGRMIEPDENYLLELRRRSGDFRWFSGRIHSVTASGGHPGGIVAGLRDVTDLVEARRRAEDREARRQAMLDTLLDPHVLLRAVRDVDGRIVDFVHVDANDAACEYMRMAHDALVGSRLLDVLPGEVGNAMLVVCSEALEKDSPLVLDDYAYPREFTGAERRYDIRAAGVGVSDLLSFTWRDVTERHRAAKDLAQRARHDQLTGLLNRAAIFDDITILLGKQPRTGHEVAVAFCDLDDFKSVNDTHGHLAGDQVLRSVAVHLRTLLRDDDVFARLGGDEFLILLNGVQDLDSAAEVAQRICEHCAQPHQYDGFVFTPRISIGVTLRRSHDDADTLIARADRAMYEAKNSGGNRVVAL